MATKVTVETVGAVTNLKTLSNAVKANKDAWKSAEAALKSVHDTLGAAKTKYQGLGEEIDLQKAKIAELKSRTEGLDTSTEKGASTFIKLKKDIASAELQLSSMTAQQTRAKKQVEYYESGLGKLRTSYKDVVSGSKAYVERLQAEGKTAEAGQAKLSSLKTAYHNLSQQYTLQKDELKKLATETGSSNTEYVKQKTRVDETATAMAKAKSEVTSLTVKYGTMNSTMAKLSDRVSVAKSRLKTIASSFKSTAIGASAAIASVGAASIAGAKKASTLQNIYKQNQNLLTTSGESAKTAIKAVTEMQKEGQKYSIKYGVSQKTIAENYQDLIKRGHTAKEALAVMKTELQGSVASGDDFNDVTKVSSQVIEAFGMKTNNTAKMVKNTKRVVNDLAYTADTTATDFQSLGKGMEYVSETANNAGFSVEETSAALGELSNHGLEADKAGTGLRKVITSLAAPTSAATAALKKIGISSTSVFKKSNGNFKSMTSIMSILESHVKNLGGSEKAAVFKTLFGSTGMAAAQILAKNSTALGELTKKVSTAGKEGDYVQKLANKNSTTAQMNVKRFKEAAEALEIMMGAKLLPVMTEAANKMTIAFNNQQAQKGLENMAELLAKLLSGTLKVVEFLGNHIKTVTAFGTALAGVWVVAKVNRFIKLIKEVKSNFGLVGDVVKKQAITDTIETETDALKDQNKVLETNKTLNSESAGGTITGSGDVSQLEKEASAVDDVAESTEAATTQTSLWSRTLMTVKGGWSKILPAAADILSKVGTYATAAISAWDLGSSVVKAIKKPSTTNKVKVASKSLFAVVGGVIGSVGGPAGIALGASIGEGLGSTQTANKLIAGIGKSYKKVNDYYKNHKVINNGDGTLTVRLSGAGEAKKKIDELNKTFNKLPSSVKTIVKKANTAFKSLNSKRLELSVSFNKKSLEKDSKSIIKTVYSLYKQIQRKAKSAEKSSVSEAKKLYSEGLISKSDLTKTEKIVKEHYNDTTKTAKTAAQKVIQITKNETKSLESNTKDRGQAINKVEAKYSSQRKAIVKSESASVVKLKKGQNVTLDGITYSGEAGITKIKKAYKAKREALTSDEGKAVNKTSSKYAKQRNTITEKYAKEYTQQESKLGTDIADEMTKSSKQQTAIMNKLKASKGKISKATAEQLIEDSYNTAKKSIAQANDDYQKTVKTAKEKHDDLISYAKDTYTGNSNYAVSMRKKLTTEANTTYKNSLSAAKQTKTDTEAQISAQEKSVVDTAAKQSKGVTDHAVKEGNNTILAAGKGAKGSAGIFNGLLKWLGKIKWLSGVTAGGTYTPTASTISGMSYARGTSNGTVGKAGLALVGEQGAELAYNAAKGAFRVLGSHGAEVTQVAANERILNAQDTAKVFSGGYGDDKILPGFASGTSTLSSFFKTIEKDATTIYKGLSKSVKSALKHPIKTVESLLKGITDISVPSEGWVSDKTWEKGYDSVGETVLKDSKSLLKKIAKAVNSSSGDANNPGGSGVTRWKPVIKKVANNMKVDLTSNGMSHILSRINQESGGSATVENDWDSNAKAGHPSIGLLQYIEPTFKSWLPTKSPHKYPNNIKHGASQIASMFNDSSWLSDISVSGGWGPTGSKRYAANGGIFNTPVIAAEAGPEAIVPLSSAKRSRGLAVLSQAVSAMKSGETNSTVESTTADSTSQLFSALGKKLDTLVALTDSHNNDFNNTTFVNTDKQNAKSVMRYTNQKDYLKSILTGGVN